MHPGLSVNDVHLTRTKMLQNLFPPKKYMRIASWCGKYQSMGLARSVSGPGIVAQVSSDDEGGPEARECHAFKRILMTRLWFVPWMSLLCLSCTSSLWHGLHQFLWRLFLYELDTSQGVAHKPISNGARKTIPRSL